MQYRALLPALKEACVQKGIFQQRGKWFPLTDEINGFFLLHVRQYCYSSSCWPFGSPFQIKELEEIAPVIAEFVEEFIPEDDFHYLEY